MARKIMGKKVGGGGKSAPAKKEKEAPVKKGKQARVWELGGTKADVAVLDFSKPAEASVTNGEEKDRESENLFAQNVSTLDFDFNLFVQKDSVGKFRGELPGLDEKEHNLGSEEEDEESGGEQSETTNQK